VANSVRLADAFTQNLKLEDIMQLKGSGNDGKDSAFQSQGEEMDGQEKWTDYSRWSKRIFNRTGYG